MRHVFFSSFKGKFELPKTKTYIRCCLILSPLSANLHFHIFFCAFHGGAVKSLVSMVVLAVVVFPKWGRRENA